MTWGDAEIRVAEDGTSVRLLRGDELVVEVAWVAAAGAPAELVTEDEVEHALVTPTGKVLQRHAVNGGWRNRWVLTAESGRTLPVADRLRVMGAEDPPGPVPVHERAPMGNWLGRLRRGRRG